MFRKELLFILLLSALVRLPWLFTVPMQEAPDEYAHWWVVEFIRTNWALPDYNQIMSAGASAVYGSLPQLGYLPHILLSAGFPASESSLFSRLGSLLAGIVTVWAAYWTGNEMFPDKRFLKLCFVFLIVFHPQLIFVHAYTNNDSTAAALCSLIFLAMIRLVKNGPTMARCLLIGVLLGFLALCKYTGATVGVVAVLAVVASARMHKSPRALLAKCLGIIVLMPAAVSGVWFWRNNQVFPGDFLGTHTMYETWAETFGRRHNYYLSPWKVIKQKEWWSGIFHSFWGLFGYMNRFLPRPVYSLYQAFMALSVMGWLKSCLSRSNLPESGRAAGEDAAIYILMAVAVVLNLLAVIWASTGNLGGPQGRYLFPSEIPVMLILLAGLNKLAGKHSRYLVGAFVVFNAVVAIGAWFMLYSIYGLHSRPY